jgi:hypothetical protein
MAADDRCRTLETQSAPAAPQVPPQTAPDNLSISLRGFDTEEHARAFGDVVAT